MLTRLVRSAATLSSQPSAFKIGSYPGTITHLAKLEFRECCAQFLVCAIKKSISKGNQHDIKPLLCEPLRNGLADPCNWTSKRSLSSCQ